MKNETHYIYIIHNKINYKLYVGQTNDPKYRWWRHKHHAIKNDRDQPIYHAIRKYGIDNFEFLIVEEWESLDSANEAETFWIEYFQACKKEFGYNIALGGGNHIIPDEVRIKIAKTLAGRSVSPATTFKPGHNINKGDKAFGSILNDNKVIEIKKLLREGVLQKDISKLFGVSRATISMIATGKIWKDVQ